MLLPGKALPRASIHALPGGIELRDAYRNKLDSPSEFCHASQALRECIKIIVVNSSP
jgi:hypothetical protein